MMEEEIPPRRVVLRGALVLGCSLFAPIALFSSPASSANAAAPTATKKMPQASVLYQMKPKGEHEVWQLREFHRPVEYLQAG